MKKTTKLKRTMSTALTAACLLSVVSTVPVFANEASPVISEQAQTRAGKAVFLSDLEYDKNLSFSQESGAINKDRNATGGPITLNVDGSAKKYIKGMSVWASGEIFYDLGENHGYDLLTTMVGVDYSLKNETYFEGGARFEILVSDNAQDWTSMYQSGIKFPRDAAESVEVSVRNKRYLKLKVDQNGSNWWDHWYDNCIFADAMLKTADFTNEGAASITIKPISYYDEIIKNANTNDTSVYKHELLMREFVRRANYDDLLFFATYYADYRECLEWLTSDVNRLEEWVLGGIAEGYSLDAEAVGILADIYEVHKEDFNDTTPLRTKAGTRGELYLRMAMATALTHTVRCGLWAGGVTTNINDPNNSNPVKRYEIFKDLYNEDKLFDEMFEDLHLEEMRWVFNNIIDNESIKWLNDYAGVDPEAGWINKPHSDSRVDPYTYIEYMFGYDYFKPEYYSPENYDKWDKKYNLSKYNITYKEGFPKLWIVFEENGVCGALGKTGSNLQGVYGVPSTVLSQPGHACEAFLVQDANGLRTWNMFNSVSSWGETGKTERMHNAMPLNWGVHNEGWQASYLFSSQNAIMDWDHYVAAEYKTWLAEVYNDNPTKKAEILNEAIQQLPYHFEAWQELVNIALADQTIPESEIYKLLEAIAQGLKYEAKPFHDLANRLKDRLSSDAYVGKFRVLVETTLRKMLNIPEGENVYRGGQKEVASFLLGNTNTEVANFSFDGEDANTIRLSSAYSEGVVWEYRLDGKEEDDNQWKRATVGYTHKLTDEEVAQITEENDIKIHIMGTGYDNGGVYTIDIQKGTTPNYFLNDLENRPMGMDATSEYRLQGEENWTKVTDGLPRFEGNQVVEVRKGATGIYLPADPRTYTFTEDNQPSDRKYIPIENLAVESYSSQQSDNEGAVKAIDGRGDTIWHNRYDGTDNDRYITIKTNNPREISAIEYVPRSNGTNGRAKKVSVYTSLDGTNFEKAAESGQWENNAQTKVINFDAPVNAQYIKIVFDESYSDAGKSFATAARFDLFENVAPKDPLTAELEYSTQSLTNQDVTVTLKNSNRPIRITNNGGNNTYTFTQNGTFTFNYEDDHGVTGSMTAEVTWIDKDAATYTMEGMPTSSTNQDVQLTLDFNEAVTVPNLDTSRFKKVSDTQYTVNFERNETVNEVFTDAAGNETPIEIVMDKIDKDAPVATIKYENRDGKVIATVEANEPIIVINNNGSPSREFTENGEFMFQIRDEAGNTAEITATVSSFVPAPGPGGPGTDQSPLTTEVEFSTTQLTNQDVTVKLINPSRPITVTNNGGNTTYTFTQNGEFTFQYVDANGVQGEHRVEVDWIDKDAATYTIDGMPTAPTNQDVELTVNFNEDVHLLNAQSEEDLQSTNDQPQFKKVTDRQYKITFTANGKVTETFYDAAGNETEIVLNMDQIDKVAPTATIQYEEKDGKVIATVVADEPVTILNNEGKNYVEFTQNGEFTFQIQDMAGNSAEVVAVVTSFGPTPDEPTQPDVPGIDQNPIQFTVSGMPEGKVNTDIILKVEFDRAVDLRGRSSGFVKESDTVYSASFVENGTLSATFYDANGKEVLVELTVDKIDKIAPTATIQYEERDGKVIVTVVADEPVTILDNGGKDYLEFDQNGVYTFKIQDEAGNITVMQAVINSLIPTPTPPIGGTGSGSVTNPGGGTPSTDPQTPQEPTSTEDQDDKKVPEQTGAPVVTGVELAKGSLVAMIGAAGLGSVLVALKKRNKK